MTERLAGNARQVLVEVLAKVDGGSGCADDMADAILTNPDVVIIALIEHLGYGDVWQSIGNYGVAHRSEIGQAYLDRIEWKS